jgi:hypothetical protein
MDNIYETIYVNVGILFTYLNLISGFAFGFMYCILDGDYTIDFSKMFKMPLIPIAAGLILLAIIHMANPLLPLILKPFVFCPLLISIRYYIN